jgi:hypothetical protein
VLLLVSVYFVARVYESKVLDTSETEAALFKNYLLYSPGALSYRDLYTYRIYPGVVDINNLNYQTLESAADFGDSNDMVAANITLFNANRTTVIAQTYYNRERYLDWLPLTHRTFLGAGTVFKADNSTYVVYIDENGTRKSGILKTEILVPRT